MADDSDEVIKPMVFEAAAVPHGMANYDLAALTADQQKMLNSLKIYTAQEDWLYLARHPQVHAVIALLLRGFFRDHPRCVHEYAAKFVLRPEFRGEVDDYLISHPAPPAPVIAAESSEEMSAESIGGEEAVVYEEKATDEAVVQWIQDLILSGFKKDEESKIFGSRDMFDESLRSLAKFPRIMSSLDVMASLDTMGLQYNYPVTVNTRLIKERLKRLSEEADDELAKERILQMLKIVEDDELVKERLQNVSENEEDDQLVKERLPDVSENV